MFVLSQPRLILLLVFGLLLRAVVQAELVELVASADTGILEDEPGFNLGRRPTCRRAPLEWPRAGRAAGC